MAHGCVDDGRRSAKSTVASSLSASNLQSRARRPVHPPLPPHLMHLLDTEPLFDRSMQSQSKPSPTTGDLPGWATQQHLPALLSLQSPSRSPSPSPDNPFQVKGFSCSTGGFAALSAAANGGFASAGGRFRTAADSSAAATGSFGTAFGTAFGVSRATAGPTQTTAGVFPSSTGGFGTALGGLGSSAGDSSVTAALATYLVYIFGSRHHWQTCCSCCAHRSVCALAAATCLMICLVYVAQSYAGVCAFAVVYLQ